LALYIAMSSTDTNEFSYIFFSPIQIDPPVELNYKEHIPQYIRAATAQSQLASGCVYIFDYVERKILFVSDKVQALYGYSTDEIEAMEKMSFFEILIHPEDLSIVETINKQGFDFLFNEVEPSERHLYWATYDLRVVSKTGAVELQNFKFLPLVIDSKGNLILAIVQVDVSTKKKPGNFLVYSVKENQFLEYSKNKKCFVAVKQKLLSEKEKQVLKMSAHGLTIKEIADKMNESLNTVHFYNKNIFKKLNVTNMKEAVLVYAQNKEFL